MGMVRSWFERGGMVICLFEGRFTGFVREAHSGGFCWGRVLWGEGGGW